MSANNNNTNGDAREAGAVLDHELELRLAKLKETAAATMPTSDHELAAHFSKVFGQSPAAAHLSPPLDHPAYSSQQQQQEEEEKGDNARDHDDSKEAPAVRPGMKSTSSQRSMSSYFIPTDSGLGQDEIDKILADSEDLLVDGSDADDLGFLDDVLSPADSQQLKSSLVGDTNVAADLERTLSKFLQTHQPPPATFQHTNDNDDDNHVNGRVTKTGAVSREQERLFGDHLDRLGSGMSLSPSMSGFGGGSGGGGDDDEASRLITQAREAAHLEAKYGDLDAARLKELSSRHEELKKGIQGLASVQARATSSSSQTANSSSSLGPPPAAVGLDELRQGGGNDDDENPDNWCCICNEDATWTCPGCDNDNYCQECFRSSHLGSDADWEMKKHRPRPFVKTASK
ncbi:hypothetical protein BGZ99_007189 [Dissophora globulifera]|uniref:Uncharacterized protein n=1 Tax=Dissophora globulifera TaxID=979702 RepID=A0A9P6RCU9_9FUNG|nr:hypothetical protein BGZ99_007189 [Dissophora globulifera]